MTDALQTLLAGIALGISIAAPPGPVTALSAQQVVSRSWLSGWLVTLGATAADGIFFVLTYYGVARVVSPGERGALFVAGGILMLYLASSTFRKGRRNVQAAPTPGRWGTSRASSPFLLGITIGLTNPYQLGWWIAIGGGMVADYGGAIAAGFFAGIVGWTLAFTATVHASVSRYQRLAPAVALASAALMACFGLWFLWAGLTAVF